VTGRPLNMGPIVFALSSQRCREKGVSFANASRSSSATLTVSIVACLSSPAFAAAEAKPRSSEERDIADLPLDVGEATLGSPNTTLRRSAGYFRATYPANRPPHEFLTR
jgi:hypothetical protein